MKNDKVILKYRGYEGSIKMCPDDAIYVGTVLNINDLVCYAGNDLDGLVDAFRTTVDDYIYDLITTFAQVT